MSRLLILVLGVFLGLHSNASSKSDSAQDSCSKLLYKEAEGKLIWHKHAADADEREFLKSLEAAPASKFIELRRQMSESRDANGDFKYRIYQPVLKLIWIDLKIRLSENLRPEDHARLQSLFERSEDLLRQNIPYKESMRFTFDYLHALDEIFVRLHPQLNGSFHRVHAEHVLEKMLDRAPDVLLYPSFRPIGLKYFARTRGIPFHIVGLHPQGLRENEPIPFADGFFMKPSEFAWHDVGHIEFMAGRDFEYIDSSFKPLERIVQEWDLSRRHIMQFWDSFTSNKDVYDAMGLILFEILHERGYQYSFAILKSQLDTPKWTEILNRKFKNDYYREFPKMNMKAFSHLEEAREKLLRFIENSRSNAQRQHITAYWGQDLDVRITHYPKINYGQGKMERVEILPNGEVNLITLNEERKEVTAAADNVILAQVSPAKKSPLTEERMKIINSLLVGKNFAWRKIIIFSYTDEIRVEMENGQSVALEMFNFPQDFSSTRVLEDRHFFQINQILGSVEREELLSFTLHKPTSVYIGTVAYELSEGEQMIRIQGHKQPEVSIPLSEVLVDPLQRGDFDE